MNRSLKHLVQWVVRATDGEVGTVRQFYFDDLTWSIRYMVVETGGWLAGRKVLISPVAMGEPEWTSCTLPVNLTREQVCTSPDIDTQKPVSRQIETALNNHYGWYSYWGSEFYAPPAYVVAMDPSSDAAAPEGNPPPLRKADPHLRSTQEVIGYHIHAIDGTIGHVDDFIVEDQTWSIRYLVVDTLNWLPGQRVLVSPQWINNIHWAEGKVFVSLTRDAVRNSPKYDPLKPLSLDYENKLRRHLQKPEVVVWVHFTFHAPPGAEVYLAGTFNNWDPKAIRLADDKKGSYITTVLLPVGHYEYKFIVNGEWCNGHGSGKQVPNAFGTTNDVLVVSSTAHHRVHVHAFEPLDFGTKPFISFALKDR